MKRVVVLIGLVLALSLALYGTASASVSSLTLDTKADLAASKTAVVVSGTIVCSGGDSVDVSVIITQSSGQVDAAGSGSATVTCSGTVQTWSATVQVVIGAAFKHGPATAIFSAFDNTDSTFFPTQTRGLKL
jgi:hypothetical protein